MDMQKITGLWKNKDKNGRTYLSGKMNAINTVMIMQNDYKRNDKDPDYWVYLKQYSKKKNGQQAPQKTGDDEL